MRSLTMAQRRAKLKATEERLRTIRRMRREGAPYARIAALLGLSASRVRQIACEEPK